MPTYCITVDMQAHNAFHAAQGEPSDTDLYLSWALHEGHTHDVPLAGYQRGVCYHPL